MAKIGTAHIEIKPVLDDEALDQIAQRIEDAVATGVQRGLEAMKTQVGTLVQTGELRVDPREVARAIRHAQVHGATTVNA